MGLFSRQSGGGAEINADHEYTDEVRLREIIREKDREIAKLKRRLAAERSNRIHKMFLGEA